MKDDKILKLLVEEIRGRERAEIMRDKHEAGQQAALVASAAYKKEVERLNKDRDQMERNVHAEQTALRNQRETNRSLTSRLLTLTEAANALLACTAPQAPMAVRRNAAERRSDLATEIARARNEIDKLVPF